MAKSNSFLATYVGGPTVIIELAGLRIMTDPTLDPAGVYDLGHITLEKYKDPADVDVDKIDLVLLSHDQHQDNLDDAGRELLTRTPKVYTTVIGADRLGGGNNRTESLGNRSYSNSRWLGTDDHCNSGEAWAGRN